MTLTIAWFRRDLRLHDHAVLATALARGEPAQPVFVFDTEILTRFTNPADRRLRFLAEALCDLNTQLQKRGGGMLVLHGIASEAIPKLATALNASAVVAAEDFEPATRARDAAVAKALPADCEFIQPLDQLLRHPARMVKEDGAPYKVFTPFFKRWSDGLHELDYAAYEIDDGDCYADFSSSEKAAKTAGLEVLSLKGGAGELLKQIGYDAPTDPEWPADAGPAILADFVADKMAHYPTARDLLANHGTSRLSPYLRHGLVSVRECMRAAHAHGHGAAWIRQLAWRDFYATILFHFPEVVTKEFVEKYRGTIPWRTNKAEHEAFFTGKTGYPIVDAGVRELLETGTMHNRARMIVASFATKHLLMDWRIGEEFFAQHLMDYDLANNNGGWQWAASTGTDAQPYFRIFNPMLQGAKFDPHGEYVRRYVPELEHMSDKDIHAPWTSKSPPANYPAPMVQHEEARMRALAAFKRLR